MKKSKELRPRKFVQWVASDPSGFVIELLRSHMLLSRRLGPQIFSCIEQLEKGKDHFTEITFKKMGA